MCGLSPLARGTQTETETGQGVARFIPAGAGNTIPGVTTDESVSVYPRWRGEHIGVPSRISEIAGLSPLARGTL